MRKGGAEIAVEEGKVLCVKVYGGMSEAEVMRWSVRLWRKPLCGDGLDVRLSS